MSDRTLHKYLNRGDGPVSTTPDEFEADGTEDLGAFGIIRGQRDRAVMLELRKKTGNVLAIGYGWIDRVELDPSFGITLHLGNQRITIRGRNLNAEARPQVRLFQQITRQKVSFVQEIDQVGALKADQQAVVIEELQW